MTDTFVIIIAGVTSLVSAGLTAASAMKLTNWRLRQLEEGIKKHLDNGLHARMRIIERDVRDIKHQCALKHMGDYERDNAR